MGQGAAGGHRVSLPVAVVSAAHQHAGGLVRKGCQHFGIDMVKPGTQFVFAGMEMAQGLHEHLGQVHIELLR